MSKSWFLPKGSEANQEGTQMDSVGYFGFRELFNTVPVWTVEPVIKLHVGHLFDRLGYLN
jgi:hypothetical protein